MDSGPPSPPAAGPPPEPPDLPAGLVEVGRYAHYRQATEEGLWLLAMGVPYWMFPVEGGYRLCVESRHQGKAEHELAQARRRRGRWPPASPQSSPADHAAGWAAPIAFAGALTLSYGLQQVWPISSLGLGRLDAAGVIAEGQLWRCLTALTLHADAGHLVGNLIGGIVFGHFLARRIGLGAAWLAIVLLGGAGNFVSAWLQYPSDYRAIGASTAVFAALGLLTGLAARQSHFPGSGVRGWLRQPLLPLAAGWILLAWLGAGGDRTDVVGHFTGFACGLCGGLLIAGLPDPLLRSKLRQALCGTLAVAVVGAAWLAALWCGN